MGYRGQIDCFWSKLLTKVRFGRIYTQTYRHNLMLLQEIGGNLWKKQAIPP